jgi:type I restriction enzyme S subunit
MATEWEDATLNELIDIKHGFAFQGQYFHDDPPGDILLTPGNFEIGGGFREGRLKYYRGPVPEDFVLSPDDLLVTMTDLSKASDTLGYPAFVPRPSLGRRYLHNQRLGKIEIRPGAPLDKRFLYYLLCSSDYRHEVMSSATGTTVRHTSPSRIKSFHFKRPGLDEQRAIAHILGTLDDKIELNRRMNETLEQIARALFKSWFVDFEPVRAKAEGRDPGLPSESADLFPDSFEESELGEIPKGWRVGTLGDVLEQRVERCVASPETAARPYVPIDCISPRSLFLMESKPGEEAKSSLTKFYKGDLLFGAMRPYFHKVCIAPFDGTTRTTGFVLRPRSRDDFSFATLRLHDPETADFATRHSTGSTIPYSVWSSSLENMPATLPPPGVRRMFDTVARPILSRIPESYFQGKTLAALRDTLLPKLISGELRVKNAERLIEAGA